MSKYSTRINGTGSAGNIFAITGAALSLMRAIGVPQSDRDELCSRVTKSQSYREAVDVVREWFPVDVENDDG